VLRSAVPPERVSVIPNAVDAVRFTPDLSKRSPPPPPPPPRKPPRGDPRGARGSGQATPSTSSRRRESGGDVGVGGVGGGKLGRVTVAVTARLAYRKGIHLLVGVIPLACARFPQVRTCGVGFRVDC